MPGVEGNESISIQATTSRTLLDLGTVGRPGPWRFADQDLKSRLWEVEGRSISGDGSSDTGGKGEGLEVSELRLLVGERKIGRFVRTFVFDAPCEMDSVQKDIRAGLLRIRVPKRERF